MATTFSEIFVFVLILGVPLAMLFFSLGIAVRKIHRDEHNWLLTVTAIPIWIVNRATGGLFLKVIEWTLRLASKAKRFMR